MKGLIFVILTVTVTSILWAAFRDAIDPNQTSDDAPAREHRKEGAWARLDGRPENIFWMVQVNHCIFLTHDR